MECNRFKKNVGKTQNESLNQKAYDFNFNAKPPRMF